MSSIELLLFSDAGSACLLMVELPGLPNPSITAIGLMRRFADDPDRLYDVPSGSVTADVAETGRLLDVLRIV